MDKREQLGKLLASVCRTNGTKADYFFKQLGIFRGQAFLLKILSEKDGLTHSEIAELLEISPAAATKVIKRMEQNNYILRKSDDRDERVSRVFIQESGVAIIKQIDQSFEQLNHAMFEGFTDDDLDKFKEFLILIRKNLNNSEPYTRESPK